MAKTTTKLPSPERWLEEQPAAAHSYTCWICERPDVKAWLTRVVALNRTAARPVSMLSMHSTLRETVGYPRTVAAMRNCAREHHARTK